MKNTPIIIGVIIILILGIGGYMYMQNKSPTSGMEEKNGAMQEGKPSSGMMSIKDLLANGGNQMCTFSSTDDYGTSTGTTYISGQNIRTDFSGTQSDGTAYEGHAIMDGSYMYTWTSAAEPGFKMAMTQDYESMIEDAEEYQNEDPTSSDQVDLNEKLDYSCSAWSPDQSMFVPPADVEFTDFSEQMKMMQDSMEGAMQESLEQTSAPAGSEDQCSVCDSLQGDAAAACRQALSC